MEEPTDHSTVWDFDAGAPLQIYRTHQTLQNPYPGQ